MLKITRKMLALSLALVVFVAMLAACGDTATNAPAPTLLSNSFVGKVAQADTLIGISVNGNKITAYVCDGKTLSEWFEGELEDGHIHLHSANEYHLLGAIDGDQITGILAPENGEAIAFQATRAIGNAGLYRLEEKKDGANYVTGWVVLPDGQQKGLRLSSLGSLESVRLLQLYGRLVIATTPTPSTKTVAPNH